MIARGKVKISQINFDDKDEVQILHILNRIRKTIK